MVNSVGNCSTEIHEVGSYKYFIYTRSSMFILYFLAQTITKICKGSNKRTLKVTFQTIKAGKIDTPSLFAHSLVP